MISLAAIIALAVVIPLLFFPFVFGSYHYYRNLRKNRIEMNMLAEENDKKVKFAENEALLAAKEQEQLRSIMVSLPPPPFQTIYQHTLSTHRNNTSD